jgi:hypothetical protein
LSTKNYYILAIDIILSWYIPHATSICFESRVFRRYLQLFSIRQQNGLIRIRSRFAHSLFQNCRIEQFGILGLDKRGRCIDEQITLEVFHSSGYAGLAAFQSVEFDFDDDELDVMGKF